MVLEEDSLHMSIVRVLGGFQEVIAIVVDKNLDKDLSKAKFYSHLIDESTDIGTDHNLVMFMHYVLNGEVCSRFLGLVELLQLRL